MKNPVPHDYSTTNSYSGAGFDFFCKPNRIENKLK
jgi:hypothetical protein